jgi:amino acid transporter
MGEIVNLDAQACECLGICCAQAGPMGPICLAIIGVILYAFRAIYGEVVTAMPVNGGSYNALLNTTTKPIAATAACLSFLSYLAT